jgi:teichuronic acid biosynthesis glycosyltransferase TuaH
MEDLRVLATGRNRHSRHGQEFAVLPNGCPEPATGNPPRRSAVAGLVGQLNERLDLEVLEAVQSAGVHVRLIGPRTDRDPIFGRRLDDFLQRDNVEWTGPLPGAQIPLELSRLGAGLTPYIDSAFNRASFPLKTLEYLAAGVGVVATDSPAVRWLGTRHVAVAGSTRGFVHAVLETLTNRNDATAEMDRRSFARRHTWEARGSEFVRLVEAEPAAVPEDARRDRDEH